MLYKYFSTLLLAFLVYGVASGQEIKGRVFELIKKEEVPLSGANIHWAGTTKGTTTDENGEFLIKLLQGNDKLVVSFIGYLNDTITVLNQSYIKVLLTTEKTLDEITIRSRSTFLDALDPVKTEVITSKELQKAACCNLSESFETNASVDVSYTDAVSGAKQIQMLGLDGTYTQILAENIPNIRGLANNYGLSYIPGTWISSIDVGKGAGSVVNGYESISGQINVEMKKPESSEPLFLNLYANSLGRLEGNLTLAQMLSSRWSTGLLLHASHLGNRVDNNEDGFLDAPLFTQYNAINRFKYDGDRLQAQFGIKYLHEDRYGGQNNFSKSNKGSSQIYGFGDLTQRVEVFTKTGIIFPEKPYKGIGLIASAVLYDKNAFFGLNGYQGLQKTVYGNLIYQSIIQSTSHSFKTGISYLLDEYQELLNGTEYFRRESVPGVYGEYHYNSFTKTSLVAGYRMDFHNLYGVIHTPRLHLKYDPVPDVNVRLSAGRGFRVPNVIGENLPFLISSRAVVIEEEIRPEVAWNYGASITKNFIINEKQGSLDLEFFRTSFENQLIADRDADPRLLRFYNLSGRSFANSFQAEVQYELIPGMDVKFAYKLYDVKATINNQLRDVPMIAKNRLFLNIGYATKFEKWKFDVTTNWTGSQRLPEMLHDHNGAPQPQVASEFVTMNGQVTKAFRKWDWYLGVENLTNFRQENPIMGAQNPFGNDFDASMVWGPVIGRVFYTGIRYAIN